MKLGGVIFDFDGTMASISALDLDGLNREIGQRLRARNIEWPDKGYLLERMEILQSRLALSWAKPEISALIAELQDMVMQSEMAAARQSYLLPATLGVVNELKELQLPVSIVSRNCGPAIKLVFPEAEEYNLLSRERIERVKPHPGHYLEAARRMGVSIGACLAIGDHIMDMQAARAAGCLLAVGVLSGVSKSGDLREHGAELILNDISELLPALRRQGWL